MTDSILQNTEKLRLKNDKNLSDLIELYYNLDTLIRITQDKQKVNELIKEKSELKKQIDKIR